jgi:hypothetical protein
MELLILHEHVIPWNPACGSQVKFMNALALREKAKFQK